MSQYLNIKEEIKLKTARNFLYSVGGIARKELDIANKIYKVYSQRYEEYLEEHNYSCLVFEYTPKRDFPEYMKQFLNDGFFTAICRQYKNNILKYVDQNDPNIYFELFNDLVKFYFKWTISTPWMKIKFLNNILGYHFDNENMRDLIFKGKSTKVNFCYLPQIEVEDKKIPEGQFYVYTYIEGVTFVKKDIDYEKVEQINIFEH